LILTASALSIKYRDLVIALAARYKLSAVYWGRHGVIALVLLSSPSRVSVVATTRK
jgi:hypothetical protein